MFVCQLNITDKMYNLQRASLSAEGMQQYPCQGTSLSEVPLLLEREKKEACLQNKDIGGKQ